MRVYNSANGYEETASVPFLWCLLFGSLYLAVKGAWGHAIISLVLAVMTSGLSWLIYPFFARRIVAKSYLRKGWQVLA